MKFIDCDIIKDLLPSYSDKILSTASNKLVEEHLQTCKNCLKEFQDMNKEIPDEIINNQDEQIDFLKGYRKSKIKSIILAVLLTICVLLSIFIILFIYDKNTESTNKSLMASSCQEFFIINGKVMKYNSDKQDLIEVSDETEILTNFNIAKDSIENPN